MSEQGLVSHLTQYISLEMVPIPWLYSWTQVVKKNTVTAVQSLCSVHLLFKVTSRKMRHTSHVWYPRAPAEVWQPCTIYVIRLELMINAQFCSTGLLFWSFSSMSWPQRQSLVTIGGFYGPDALRGIQTPVGSRVQCTFCVILLLHIYLSVVYLFVCLFICILLELSTYFVLNFLNCWNL